SPQEPMGSSVQLPTLRGLRGCCSEMPVCGRIYGSSRAFGRYAQARFIRQAHDFLQGKATSIARLGDNLGTGSFFWEWKIRLGGSGRGEEDQTGERVLTTLLYLAITRNPFIDDS